MKKILLFVSVFLIFGCTNEKDIKIPKIKHSYKKVGVIRIKAHYKNNMYCFDEKNFKKIYTNYKHLKYNYNNLIDLINRYNKKIDELNKIDD